MPDDTAPPERTKTPNDPGRRDLERANVDRLVSLDAIGSELEAVDEPDDDTQPSPGLSHHDRRLTPDSLADSERRKLDAEARLAETKATSAEQNLEERKRYADRIFKLIVCWLAGVGLMLFFQGQEHASSFYLDETVLIALIGGTTANVLVIFYVVVKYLFPPSG